MQGPFGAWAYNYDYCNENQYVIGYSMKIEASDSDNTALNGVNLKCADYGSTTATKDIYSTTGRWGRWKSAKECTDGKPVTGFRLKYVSSAHDDVGATNLELWCGYQEVESGSALQAEYDSDVDFGSWSGWKRCPTSYAVVGFKTRVGANQGRRDYTAMNGINMVCKKYDCQGTGCP